MFRVPIHLKQRVRDEHISSYPEVVAKIDYPSPITVRSQLLLLHIASRPKSRDQKDMDRIKGLTSMHSGIGYSNQFNIQGSNPLTGIFELRLELDFFFRYLNTLQGSF